MSRAVQMNYGEPKAGLPGGLVDRAAYSAVTRCNEQNSGAMFFGYGVVRGSEPGKNVKIPDNTATADKFEGVVMYSANVEMNIDGDVYLEKGRALDILQSGKVYVQVADDVEPIYGDSVYLIVEGDESGKFTNTSGSSPKTVQIKAKFLGTVDDGIAPAQFYDIPQI